MGAALLGLLILVDPWLDMGASRKVAALGLFRLAARRHVAAAFAAGATSPAS